MLLLRLNMDENDDTLLVKIEPKQEEEIHSFLQEHISVSNEVLVTIKDEVTNSTQCSKSPDENVQQQSDFQCHLLTRCNYFFFLLDFNFYNRRHYYTRSRYNGEQVLQELTKKNRYSAEDVSQESAFGYFTSPRTLAK
ncbi:uncharacterized protein LOC116172669 [Photinus pyralis]|uniref:uncharacterized protein LOC116172669 n=1 Tax=Photinus pyralis TaxID=7054 RepID=UPI001266F4D0|nr:uncharacterized protein LOC116172669 [Photinus pyralis]